MYGIVVPGDAYIKEIQKTKQNKTNTNPRVDRNKKCRKMNKQNMEIIPKPL